MAYLFTRSARLAAGNMLDSVAWSTRITEKVNTASELDVALWSTVFSPGLGTLTWTTVVDDLGALVAAETGLLADSGYVALAEEGAKYVSAAGFDDGLLNLVFADPADATADPQYATVVQAVLNLASTTRGIELGVEIAQRVKRITGRLTSFGVASTGPYGGVAWVGLYDTVEQVQQAEEALAADADFAKLIDEEASACYLPGTGVQTVHRRVA